MHSAKEVIYNELVEQSKRGVLEKLIIDKDDDEIGFYNGKQYKITYINKETKKNIIEHLGVGGSHFSPHFMIECLKANVKCIEIPINYYARVGESKITGVNNLKTIKLGLLMIFYIFFQRFKVIGSRSK